MIVYHYLDVPKKCVETYSLSNAAALNLGEEVLNKHEHNFQNKKKTKRITKAQTGRRRIIDMSHRKSIPKPLYRAVRIAISD